MTKRILHRCNSVGSIVDALKKYDGVEVDVRRLGTKLVLAHDEDGVQSGPYLTAVLRLAASEYPGKTLALNIKEHGLANLLAENLSYVSGIDYFVFDVPGVELPRYHGLGIRVFARMSYCEHQRPENTGGVVVDPFREGDQKLGMMNLGIMQGGLPAVYTHLPVAMISNGCHGRTDEPNHLIGVDYLIGKEFELMDAYTQGEGQ